MKITLRDVMNRDCPTLSLSATVRQAERELKRNRKNFLPVCADKKPVGVIGRDDIEQWKKRDGANMNTPVSEVMARDFCFCYEDDSVDDAARVMSRKELRRLLVIDRDDTLVGTISLEQDGRWRSSEKSNQQPSSRHRV